MKHLAYIGLGSNLGNGPYNLDAAIGLLQSEVGEVVYTSGYVESEPWGFETEHFFTNAVTVIRTELEPFDLLDVTQRIEREMGRTHKHAKGEPYTDRVIDLDILLYDDLHLESERLTIPHPLISERSFVYQPLQECLDYVNGIEKNKTNT